MNIIKLDSTHIKCITNFFSDDESGNHKYQTFINTYTSGLKNYHAFGFFSNDKKITTIIGFYQSVDDASWYWNFLKVNKSRLYDIKNVLDKVIEFNEKSGLYKFYSMIPMKYSKMYKKLVFSDINKNRYEYFDEFYLRSNHVCKFTLPWQILYDRELKPYDSIVKCNFLKNKFRKTLFDAGNI